MTRLLHGGPVGLEAGHNLGARAGLDHDREGLLEEDLPQRALRRWRPHLMLIPSVRAAAPSGQRVRRVASARAAQTNESSRAASGWEAVGLRQPPRRRPPPLLLLLSMRKRQWRPQAAMRGGRSVGGRAAIFYELVQFIKIL